MEGQLFLVQVNDVLRRRGAAAFVCECGTDGCNALVALPLTVYDGIRAVEGSVLADGHPAAAAESTVVGAQPSELELPALRESLRDRVMDVWDRLNDAVSELHELHEIPREEIVERVGDALDSPDATA